MTSDNQHTLDAIIHASAAIERIAENRPRWLIQPHDKGQMQFLQSRHMTRVAIPGNGWGKTTAMAMAADMLMQKDDPFNPDMLPKWPVIGLWVCQKFQQIDILRHQLEEEVWTRPWSWNQSRHFYSWPNGAQLHIVSGDSDWKHIQGVALDFACFDEHPDRKLWNELQFRRRGKRKTRYMVAATMTQGLTWFVREVIQPWEEYHRQRKLNAEQARDQQQHPAIWVWDAGGIRSNPGMTEEDYAHYESQSHSSSKELEVRLKGGYADFTGEAVFDKESLDRQVEHVADGREGSIEYRELAEPPRIVLPDGRDATDIATRRRGGRNRRHWVDFSEGVFTEGGTVTVWEEPDLEETYVAGADFAAGLVGRDYDALLVGRKTDDGGVVQVAEARGWWGDSQFADIIYALCVWYYNAFLVGERQFGLPTLRRLYDEYRYPYIYRGRTEAARSRRPSDLLGHHRSGNDPVIPNLRAALVNDRVRIRSAETLGELRQYQYQPKFKGAGIDADMLRSADLITGAPPGLNDDLVLACGYMWHAAREVGRFHMPPADYAPGTYGEIFQNRRVLKGLKPRKATTWTPV